MNKGKGPMQQMEANIATLVPAGDKNWISMFTEDNSKWIFNTECCATTAFYQHAQCIKY
jgi:hypothetical protein